MTRTRSLDYDEKQEAVVETAARVIAERGYAQASMNEIAEACGVSKGHIYYYFASKEAILHEIMDKHLGVLLAVAEEAVGLDVRPREKFERLIAAVLRIYAHARDKHVVFMTSLAFLPPEMADAIVSLEKRFVRLVQDLLVELNPAGRREERVVAMLLFGMINWTYTWYDAEGPVDVDALARRVSAIFLDGYLAEIA
jgi:AcrR family transcriptional regulator